MCRFQLYQKLLAERLPHRQADLIKTLQSYRRDSSLSRLEAARAALLNLKAQLNQEASPDLCAAVKEAIERLEATS